MNAKCAKCLVFLALSAVFCLPGMAMGTTLYTQNFDAVGQAALISPGAGNTAAISTVLPGWSVTANNTNQLDVFVANGTVGGNAVGAYLATGDGTDFGLSSYQNNVNRQNFITYTYTATGTVSNITGSFDYESAWTRWASNNPRTAGFEVGMTYRVNAGAATATTPANSWQVSNANVTLASDLKTWLTDARMDALGLSSRHLSFSITGVTLNPGDQVTFQWLQLTTAGDRNMAQGIDNFTLNGTTTAPLPPTLLLLCTGLLGLIGLRRKPRRGNKDDSH